MKLQSDLYIVIFISNFTDMCIPNLLFIFFRILWKVLQWNNAAQKLNRGVAQPSKYLSPIWWILGPVWWQNHADAHKFHCSATH